MPQQAAISQEMMKKIDPSLWGLYYNDIGII